MSSVKRRATHAGSWYSDDSRELDAQLTSFLDAADAKNDKEVVAVVSPHAGYSYSGPTAGFSYKNAPRNVKRIFLLGPSHHLRSSKCLLSTASHYESPVGNLKVDEAVVQELLKQPKLFDYMHIDDDEREHSLEMCATFLARIMQGVDCTLVPIMVGSTSFSFESKVGKALAPYFDQPETLFVISTDFCHWGSRFQYQHYKKEWGNAIHESIKKLDELGMEALSTLDPKNFDEYLHEYQNTICGRHPLGILLHTIKASKYQHSLNWLDYTRSDEITRRSQSSVSYAAGIVTREAVAAA